MASHQHPNTLQPPCLPPCPPSCVHLGEEEGVWVKTWPFPTPSPQDSGTAPRPQGIVPPVPKSSKSRFPPGKGKLPRSDQSPFPQMSLFPVGSQHTPSKGQVFTGRNRLNSPGSSQANPPVAGAWLPGTFEGAQCKETGSRGVGTGTAPSPSLPIPAARCGRHSIPSHTTFPPAPSLGTISRTAGEAEPRVGGESSSSPPARFQGVLLSPRTGEGLGCPEPPPVGHRPSSGSRIHCTAQTSSWARRRCASAPRMERAAGSAETPLAFPIIGVPWGQGGAPGALQG